MLVRRTTEKREKNKACTGIYACAAYGSGRARDMRTDRYRRISALTTGESAVDRPVFRVLWEAIQCHADIQERFYPSSLIFLTSGGLIRAFAKSEANIPMERPSMIIMILINSGAFKIGSQRQKYLTLHRQCCWHQGAIFRYSAVMIQLHN